MPPFDSTGLLACTQTSSMPNPRLTASRSLSSIEGRHTEMSSVTKWAQSEAVSPPPSKMGETDDAN